MPAPDTSGDFFISELKAAGWTQETLMLWRSPNGSLYHGLLTAWRAMKAQTKVIPIDSKSRAAGDTE